MSCRGRIIHGLDAGGNLLLTAQRDSVFIYIAGTNCWSANCRKDLDTWGHLGGVRNNKIFLWVKYFGCWGQYSLFVGWRRKPPE
jgi:CRISPR/Cas system-associated endoribonuclease Cas2